MHFPSNKDAMLGYFVAQNMRGIEHLWVEMVSGIGDRVMYFGLYPQIRQLFCLLYRIKIKAAISLPFNLHCKAIAALVPFKDIALFWWYRYLL